MSEWKAKRLIVDTGALLHRVDLRSWAETCWTTPEVMREVRDKASRSHVDLQYIALDILQVRRPAPASLQAVAAFAKLTGDAVVLSATDLGILALAYELEREYGCAERIRTRPLQAVTRVGPSAADLTASMDQLNIKPEVIGENNVKKEEEEETEQGKEETIHVEDKVVLQGQGSAVTFDAQQSEQTTSLNSDDNLSTASTSSDEDGDGWITPRNIQRVRDQAYGPGANDAVLGPPEVACITTDFAMQNVLLQMNLNIVSVNGYRIRHLKTWVLRCHACYQVTKDMTKKFCPRCGHNALIRTSMSIDPTTHQPIYHLQSKFQYRLRGTKYNLPPPQTGRNAKNLILCEDQKEFINVSKKTQRQAKHLDSWNLDGGDDLASAKHRRGNRHVTVGYGRKNPNEARRRV